MLMLFISVKIHRFYTEKKEICYINVYAVKLYSMSIKIVLSVISTHKIWLS